MKRFYFQIVYALFVILIFSSNNILFAQDDNEEKKKKESSFIDPEDGAFDISEILKKPAGFLPVPIIITEPAVGIGGGLAVLFFHPQKKKYDIEVPPNISGAFGLYTSNKTWAAGLFHMHIWGPDKIRYLGAVAKPVVNIKYYGNNNKFLSENPIQLKLDAWTVIQRVQVRIAKTDLFIGASYLFFTTNNTADTLADKPLINDVLSKLDGRSTISALQPMINWDSRDNIFSPTKGLNSGLEFTYSATWLGSDDNFYSLNPYFLGYLPVSKKIFSGWRFDATFMFGSPPLYALPFIQLRGVPAMMYQSDNTMLVETEWRFVVYKRWSLDVFTGTGKAFRSFENFGSATWVYNYGAGFRYELARSLGLLAGLDFAMSNNNEFAFYITIGSAWNK